MTKLLTPQDLAALFGGTEDEVREWCGSYLASADLSYRPLTAPARDRVILDLLKRLSTTGFSRAGESRRGDWERGWSENLAEYQSSGNVEALVPKYVKPDQLIRLNGDWVHPCDAHFGRTYLGIFRAWLVHKYLAAAPAIYEFGCGPGSHLAYMAQALPGTRLFGLDWAEASVRIIDEMRRTQGWPIHGLQFDFFHPNQDLLLEDGAAVLTFGALEQVGDRFEPFLEWVLARRPAICVHVEGVEELYDDDSLFDWMALSYHRHRGYLSGFLTRLRALEAEGRIAVDVAHRHRMGGGHDDTYSTIVWRPLP